MLTRDQMQLLINETIIDIWGALIMLILASLGVLIMLLAICVLVCTIFTSLCWIYKHIYEYIKNHIDKKQMDREKKARLVGINIHN